MLSLLATVILAKTPCTSSYVCSNVKNTGGLNIEYLDDNPNYQRLVVNINGVVYDSGLYLAKVPVNVPLYGPNDVVYATVNISVTIGPCVRSGRVTVCPKTVVLESGSLSSQPLSQ
jgi:hypothetical protein